MEGQFKLHFDKAPKKENQTPENQENKNPLDYIGDDLLDDLYKGNDESDEFNRYKKD